MESLARPNSLFLPNSDGKPLRAFPGIALAPRQRPAWRLGHRRPRARV